MLKMIVTFKNGIPVKKLPALEKLLKPFGGDANFVPEELHQPCPTCTCPTYAIDGYTSKRYCPNCNKVIVISGD
jgi:hypothetical protein